MDNDDPFSWHTAHIYGNGVIEVLWNHHKQYKIVAFFLPFYPDL